MKLLYATSRKSNQTLQTVPGKNLSIRCEDPNAKGDRSRVSEGRLHSIRISLLAGMLLICSAPTYAAVDGFIWLDVSIKVIVDPATGMVPATMNDDLLRDSFDDVNRWLLNNRRGYRARLVDLDAGQNFRRIGGLNDSSGPGKWYETNLKTNSAANAAFETEAEANKALYAWNDNAINVYFNNGGYSSAQFPQNGRDLVQSAYALFVYDLEAGEMFSRSYKVAGNLLHELGHYFGLPHTFNGEDNEDDIADTALDPEVADSRNETAVRDGIAQYNFNRDFIDLTSVQQILVDNTANNGMSYYQLFYDDPNQSKVLTDAERFGPTRFLFTELQMDQWSDYANSIRAAVASGRMIFVGGTISPIQIGSSTSPFDTVADGIFDAVNSGRDIVLLRPGSYNEQLIFSKPVTLRATRVGPAVIGIP